MALPSCIQLPTELIYNIIDEAWEVSPERAHDTIYLPSSLAYVSHDFRRGVNVHRFSTITLGKDSTGADINSFLELIQADVWTSNATVVPHIRRVELLLAVTTGSLVKLLHPSVANGSLTRVLELIFRGRHSVSRPKDMFTLALHGHPKLDDNTSTPYPYNGGLVWTMLTTEFISYLQMLVASRIGNLELWSFRSVPISFLKESMVRMLKLYGVSFEPDRRFGTENGVLRDKVEILDFQHFDPDFILSHESWLWTLASVRILSIDQHCAECIKSFWPHMESLKTLIMHIPDDHQTNFEIPYMSLSGLRRLVLNVVLSNSKRNWFDSKFLDILGKNIPAIPELELVLKSDLAIMGRFQNSSRVGNTVENVNCDQIDAFLEHYCTITAPNSTLTIRFLINVSEVARTEFDIHKFRRGGMGMLRNAFPLLNSRTSRRGVFDVEFRLQHKERKHKGAIPHEAIFSAIYNPVDGTVI
ncbi:hypothetical protein BDN70DRAFT_877213 [Pholiota conissans]|uniref:Uncharacterized protein n=1 Tax=Pholiota conissans TaxID=109636 RepID=A0A9P5Z3G3_9AGAR|nr:hypothetical protein BDN70DRAFT_877213 [Pholiota conissans]